MSLTNFLGIRSRVYRYLIKTAEFCIIKQGKIGYLKLGKLMLSISCETIKASYSSRFQSGTSQL